MGRSRLVFYLKVFFSFSCGGREVKENKYYFLCVQEPEGALVRPKAPAGPSASRGAWLFDSLFSLSRRLLKGYIVLRKLFCILTTTIFIFSGERAEASGKPKARTQGQQQTVTVHGRADTSASKRCCKPAPLKRSPFMRFTAQRPPLK